MEGIVIAIINSYNKESKKAEKNCVEKASQLLLDVIEHTPVYKLSCLPDRSAADLLYQTLIDGGVY